MNPTTAQILAWVTGRLGGWLTPIIIAAISWLVVQATTHLPFLAEPLSTIDQVAIASTVVAIIMAGINALTNKYLTQGTKAIQQAARDVQFSNPDLSRGQRAVDVDGVPGNITTGVVTDLLNKLAEKK
jgi:hypothetical protein